MGAPLILAIDQGTTSTRALIFDETGKIIAKAQKELALITPHSGWIEQDAAQIWNDVQAVCKDVLAQTSIDDVIGIGITNQRETTVLWDKKTGAPVYNAIVWQDRRTAEFCTSIQDIADDVQSKTGLRVDPYFSATKIKWILDHTEYLVDDVLFGTVETYLLWKLTDGKVHASDASNAARTMVFDIHRQCWDKDLCAAIGVPMDILPDVQDNMFDFGVCDLFDKPLPILAMAGDQQAATFGQSCFETGMVKSTYGTGCFALMNTGDECVTSRHDLLSTIAWRMNGKVTYALEGSIFVAGAAIQFLRDQFKFFDDAAKSEDLALSVSDTDGVVFVPAFTGLGAPYWNAQARGALFGLSRGTTSAHITRAVYEAQAFQTRDLITAMERDAAHDIKIMRVDGGLAHNDTVCQMIANQTDCRIDRPINTEATVWGVAAMAFLQAGVFTSFDDITKRYGLDQSFTPKTRDETAYNQWKKAIKATEAFAVRCD